MKRKFFDVAGIASLVVAGFLGLLVASTLIREHVTVVREAQTFSLPIISELPELEWRSTVLNEQLELTELHEAMRHGSFEEQMRVYVLPQDIDLDRLIAIFDVLNPAMLANEYVAEIGSLVIGEKESKDERIDGTSVTLDAVVHRRGISFLIDSFRLMGILTVADALTEDERALLLASAELENPAGIVALEQFFAADLLTYAREPQPIEAMLRRSFVSPEFAQAFNQVLSSSLLLHARQLLGGSLGQMLYTHGLWPFPFLAIEEVMISARQDPDWYFVTLKLNALSRRSMQ